MTIEIKKVENGYLVSTMALDATYVGLTATLKDVTRAYVAKDAEELILVIKDLCK
jgi:hypothetical protein